MLSRDKLIKAYTQAGEEFVADRLKKVFCEIENQNDIALHNDMVREIQVMIGPPGDFLRSVSRLLISRPKNFMLGVGSLVIVHSLRNYGNEKVTGKKAQKGNRVQS